MEKQKLNHYLALFIGIMCISWSAPFIKLANVEGIASAFYRMLFASLACIPIYFLYKNKKPISKEAILWGALGGLFFGCDIALWNTALVISKASVSTLLANLAPVWVGFGAMFIFRERPKILFWIGTTIAILGVTIIVGFDKLKLDKFEIGYILSIAASFFYASYLLSTQKIRTMLDTISFTTISMISSTIVLFIFALLFNTKLTGFSAGSWWALIGVGLISQLTGWLAINYALGYIKSSIASVSLLSQSVFTAIIAYPVLNEKLTLYEAIGGVVVLLGIYLVNKKNAQQKTTAIEATELLTVKN